MCVDHRTKMFYFVDSFSLFILTVCLFYYICKSTSKCCLFYYICKSTSKCKSSWKYFNNVTREAISSSFWIILKPLMMLHQNHNLVRLLGIHFYEFLQWSFVVDDEMPLDSFHSGWSSCETSLSGEEKYLS